MAFRPRSNMFKNFLCNGHLLYQNQSNSTVGTLIFDMDFDDSSTICLIFLVLTSIFDGTSISQWEHHIPVISCDEGIACCSTRTELFYFLFTFYFRPYPLWVLTFRILQYDNTPNLLYLRSHGSRHPQPKSVKK